MKRVIFAAAAAALSLVGFADAPEPVPSHEPGIPLSVRTGLPPEIRQMTMLVGEGLQYIVTEVTPTQTTVTECAFGKATKTGNTTILSQNFDANKYLLSGGSSFTFWGGGSTKALGANDGTSDYFFRMSPTGESGKCDLVMSNVTAQSVTTVSAASISFTSTDKLAIFGSVQGGYLGTYTLYSLKLSEGEDLLGDFIPAYSIEEGAAGLYDFKTQKFYPSNSNTAFPRQDFLMDVGLELVNGKFQVTMPKSDAQRTVVLCSGAEYVGTEGWTTESDPETVAADATSVSFDKPEGWGSTALYARVKVQEGGSTFWSKTIAWLPPAQLGMEKPTVVDSAFGSSVIKANVTGIGLSASSATLTLDYGTASDDLSRAASVQVTGAGGWVLTLIPLAAGERYYARATLANGTDEPFVSEVFDFVQPEIDERGTPVGCRAGLPFGYVQMTKLVSTGSQNIDTLVNPTAATGAELRFGEVVGDGSGLFSQAFTYKTFSLVTHQGKYRYFGADNGNGEVTLSSIAANTDYLFTVAPTTDNKCRVAFVNATDGTSLCDVEATVLLGGSTKNIYVFGQDYKSSCSLYSFKITEGGELVADFVPAYEKSTDRAGLYDLKRQGFYPSSTATAFEQQELLEFPPLEFADGEFRLTLPASTDANRSVVLCSGASYGGVDAWTTMADAVLAGTGAATVTLEKPDGWGRSVFFVRAKIIENGETYWSKTIIADPPAPIGVGTPVLVAERSSAADVRIPVLGLGLNADSAEVKLVWWGDDETPVEDAVMTVTAVGEVTGLVCPLTPGHTYQVKARVTNNLGETAESDALTVTATEPQEKRVSYRALTLDAFQSFSGGFTATLSYGAGDAGTIYACLGAGTGGAGTNGWEHVVKVADVDASAGSVSWTLNSGWGTSNAVVRFCLVGQPYDKRFDYLASTGTQYIDTKCPLKAGMELTLEWAQHASPSGEDKGWGVGTSTSTDNVTGGGRHRSIGIVPWMFGADRQFDTVLTASELTIGDWYLDRVTTTNGVVRYEMTHESDGFLRQITPVNLPKADYVSGNNIYIYRDVNNASNGRKRVRSFTLSDLVNGTVLLDLVPCEKDGTACFYNRANGEFLYSGSGTFVTGPEIADALETLGTTEFMIYEPPAPLGVEKPKYVSSEFGSAVVAAQVTGIGTAAASATLTFAYGTTTNCADGTVAVTVTGAGLWTATLPRLVGGQTYYVKATLDNHDAEPVTSEAIPFDQPEFTEEGCAPTLYYAQQSKLIGHWDGFENAGRGVSDPAATTWADLTGITGDLTVNSSATFDAVDGCLVREAASVVGSDSRMAYGDAGVTGWNTIEFVARRTTRQEHIVLFSPYNHNGGVLAVDGYSKVGSNFSSYFNASDFADSGLFATLTLVKDGSDWRLYQNGVQCSLAGGSEGFGGGMTDAIAVGGRATSTSNYLRGRVYAVRLYSSVLSADEIAANAAMDKARFSDKSFSGYTIAMEGGKFVVSLGASGAAREVRLYAGETYGGTNDWGAAIAVSNVAAGVTSVVFDKPTGWGSSVFFVRAQVGEGSDAIWSNTITWEPPAPLGVKKPKYVSSEFGSSVIAATVTGIGKTASEATLTFAYGTTPNCADGTVTVENVTDAGSWSGTLPYLQSGQTYYVKATLSNTTGDTPVTSDVYDFVQPKVAEPGVPLGGRGLPAGYVQMKKLTSTGNQRIDTEIVPTTTTTVEFEFGECLTKATAALYFGQEWGDPRYMLDTQSGNNNFCFHGTGTHDLQMLIDAADDYRLTTKLIPVQAGTANVIIEDLTKGTATTNVSDLGVASGVAWRFFGAPGRTDRNSKYSFYSFKSWDGGALTGDFVPVWSKAEEKAGLYDFVSKKFYTTQTGTAFARQEDVEQPLPPELVDGRLLATFPASVADRSAYLCSGATYGGTNGWTTTSDAVTIDAGETTASFDLPEGWGETVWYARVKIVEGDQETWSETLIAADANLPAVTLNVVDGLGGDTMVVKGTVDSLGGESCTLKVMTGTSEDAITEEWTGLEGMTVTETGDFEFSLFENDTSASRYLTPGETYFVRVELTGANGKVAWSSVKSVTMADAAVFKSTSVAYSKRVMTVTAQMAEIGICGTVDVELWVGVDAASLTKVAGPATVTRPNEDFTLSYELPLYETSYIWQLKAVNVTTGGTASPVTPTATANATAPDSTTYKWTGEGGDNKWTTAANWSDDKGGDCLGYPQTKNSTATFAMSADVEIDLPRNGTTLNVGTLNLNTADIDVRFHSADTNGFGLVVSSLNLPGARSRWTLDGAYVCHYNGGQINMSAGSVIELKNAANLYTGNLYSGNAADTTVVLSGDSWMSVGILYMGRGHSLLQIEDSTFCTRSDAYFNWNKPSQDEVRFIGTHPQWLHDTTSGFRANSSDPQNSVNFNFLVPVGGYTTAPIRMLRTNGAVMGNTDEITINVLPESPAARVDATLGSVPLIEWVKGINKTWVVWGTLPNELGQDAFSWHDPEAATPTNLSVKIVGSTHTDRLTVAGIPADVPDVGVSPSYGDNDNMTSARTLTAPDSYVEFAEGARRAICTGWKLYDVDPATQEMSAEPVATGDTNACDWTPAGHWQKLVWQWRVEEKVVVTPVAGGTVTASSDWTGEGTPPTLTATPDAGMMFAGWTGDVTGPEQFENPLQLVDNGSPRTIAATFIAGTAPTATNSVADLDFSGFAHHTYITFDGYDGAAPIKDFPALILLEEGKGGFSYADCAQANGGDVRFTLGDGRELASEVVTWNPNGTSEIWVNVPELTKETRIMMFWGNASAPARPLELKPFGSDYKLVYEMGATGATAQDSGLSGAHGFLTPTVASVPGVVGMARSFDKSKSERVVMPSPSVRDVFQPNKVGTWELWFKCPAGSTKMPLFSMDTANWNSGFIIDVNGNGLIETSIFGGNGISTEVKLDVWHHLAVEVDPVNGPFRFYVDGEVIGEKSQTRWFNGNVPGFYLAYSYDSSWGTYYTGELDEVRVSAGLRGGDYPRAVYRNVMVNDEFMTFETAPESRLEFKTADCALGEKSESCRFLPTSTAHVFADGVEVAADAVPADAKQVVKRVGVVRQYRVTVAAGAGGTVEPALDGAWVDDGTILDVTATVTDESKAFHSWDGNCPTLEVFSASMKLPVDRARTIGAVFAPCTEIAGGTEEESAQTAGAAVTQAVANASVDVPSVVLLGEGLYQLPSSSSPCVTVAKPIVIRSADGVGKAVIDCAPGKSKISLQLKHVGAAVDGIAFSNAVNGTGWNLYGSCLSVQNGHAQNCIFENNIINLCNGSLLELAQGVNSACWAKGCVFRNNNGNTTSEAVSMRANGGLVDSCVFTNNVAHSGSGLLTGNAIVRNCLFAGNDSPETTSSKGGAFRSTGNTVVENCTFMDNHSGYQGGAVWGEAILVNCAFGGNSVEQSSNGPDWYDSTVTRLVGSLSPNFRSDELVGGNKVGQPVVRDKQAGDYRPTGVSPTTDLGFYTPSGYALGATDLSGAPRLYNRLVDSGCYEYTPGEQEEFAVNVTADTQNGTDELTVTFTSLVTGADDVSYSWNFGDGGTSTEANPVHTYTRAGYFTVRLTVTDNKTHDSVDFTGGDKMITVLPSVCYVRAAGTVTSEKPFATPETAATNIYDAFLIGPSVIDIGEGEIDPGATISFEHPITLRGKGPDKTFVNMKSGRVFYIKHAGDVFADLTIYNGQKDWNVSMVNVSALALITNCVIRNYKSSNQPAVDLCPGRLVDCVVCNGSHSSSDGSQPGGVWVRGGGSEIINCVITNCTLVSVVAKGVGVTVAGNYTPTPVIRNTLIANNRNTCKNADSTAAGIGLYLGGPAIVENCTIADNVTDYGTNAGVYVASANVRIVNTIASGNFISAAEEPVAPDYMVLDTVTDCEPDHSFLSGDALFNRGARKSKPYWSLRGNSPCKDAGVKLDWMEGETDLIGNPRAYGGKPDMGCYENLSGGMAIIVR